ncbi:MAG: ROK family transcriptional regulator [Actinomycetaceae bacterium]|nr:ROK family transcriptional regulator [Actinomycetaceae bacterium]MDY6083348.1 ROK family transcriptional regulator [Actinomycetaceae bacterium]
MSAMIHGESGSDSSGSRLEAVRSHNLALLARTAVTSAQPLSRADLATSSGLSRSTVSRLVDTLIEHGILKEQASTRTNDAGRPSVPLVPSPHTHVAIGSEITDSAIRVRVIDLGGHILAEYYREIHHTDNANDVLSTLDETLEKAEQQILTSQMNLVGIACGIPGLISPDDTTVYSAPSLGWHNVDISELLKPSTHGTPYPIEIDNSINLSAFNEIVASQRAGHPAQDFLFLSGSTGIGGAIVRHGEIEAGTHGWAGEFGHIPAHQSDALCSCGQRGCLETVAGRKALMTAGGFGPDDSIANLYAALSRKDPKITKTITQIGAVFGDVLSGVMNLLDLPEIRLGGILGQLYPYIQQPIMEQVNRRVLYGTWAPIILSASRYGEESAADGGAWKMLLSFLAKPHTWRVPSDYALHYRDVDETQEVTIE